MRNVLYQLGGRKFIAFFVAVATTLIMWGYHQVQPYEALIALVTAAAAYMGANVVDGATDAERGKGQPL